MERIKGESAWFFCPGLADVFVWREAFQRLESAAEVVGGDEVGQVAWELVVCLVVIAIDGRLFEGGTIKSFGLKDDGTSSQNILLSVLPINQSTLQFKKRLHLFIFLF